MDEWGFFELGKLERFGNAGAEVCKCDDWLQKLDVLEKRRLLIRYFGFFEPKKPILSFCFGIYCSGRVPRGDQKDLILIQVFTAL